jgi:rSAM/selenodomain-associated transferase 1
VTRDGGARARDVVYVVAKAPRAGQSKTRLCPPLWPEAAATLAAAFLRDTVALASRSGADVRLICRDEGEREALLTYELAGATVHVQAGKGLGAALESAFVQGKLDGYRAVGVLGMDSPSLRPEIVARAFACLREGADVGLGPSEDGGYYLLAAREAHPGLFRRMAWSTSGVARETLARGGALGLRVHLVERWLDVDDAESLRALRAQLEEAGPEVAPHTRATLRELEYGR